MVKLNWNVPTDRKFETGLDRGALYVDDNPGVPWIGLTGVDEANAGVTLESYYQDGVKYDEVLKGDEFSATISAFAAPPEFGVCDGTRSIANGLFATNQKRKSFGFSYRTLIGNAVEGVDHGYKLHIVYDALAQPAQKTRTTIGASITPSTFSWLATTVPKIIPGVRPTAHLVIDSTKADSVVLGYIEHLLYGSPEVEPRLPSPSELLTIFGWDVHGPDVGVEIIGVAYSPKEIVVNLFNNPSFESTSGTVVTRRNLNPAPIFSSGVSGWSGGSGVTAANAVGGREYTLTAPISGAILSRSIGSSVDIAFSEGEIARSSVDISVPSDSPHSVSLDLAILFSTSTANVGGVNRGPTVVINPGERKTLIVPPLASPATADRVRPSLYWSASSANPLGARFVVHDGWMVTKNQVGDEPFSGNKESDGARTYTWAGAVNASQSIETTKTFTGASQTGRQVVQSTEWSAEGAASLKIQPTATNQDSANGYTIPISTMGLVPGDTVTIKAILRMLKPMDSFHATRSRGFWLANSGGVPVAVTPDENKAPNEMGEHVVSWTVVIPADTATLRLANGSQDPVWWDLLTVIKHVTPEVAVTRRNIFPSPRASAAVASPVFSPNSAATVSDITDFPGSVNTAARFTRAAAGNARIITLLLGNIMPAGGQIITLRALIRASAATTLQVQARVTAGTSAPATNALLGNPVIPIGTTEIILTAPSINAGTTVNSGIVFITSNGAIGDTLDITGITLEVAGSFAGYFDYLTPPTLTTRYRSLGTNDASITEEYTVLVDPYTGGPFSGSSKDVRYKNQLVDAIWLGTTDLSTSQIEIYTNFTTPGIPGHAYLVDGNLLVANETGVWINYGPPPPL